MANTAAIRRTRPAREALQSFGIPWHCSPSTGLLTALSTDHGENVRFCLMVANVDAVVFEADRGSVDDVVPGFNIQIVLA